MSTYSSWTEYAGLLCEAVDVHPLSGESVASRVLAWENVTGAQVGDVTIPDTGATFGFVASGAITISESGTRGPTTLTEGQWFALPGGAAIALAAQTRVVAMQRAGWRAMRSFGGPIEPAGRLRYIDGCTDSLLAPPPLRGDPCLNHLHFPAGIEQTAHTHPTMRAGIVARGSGWCETSDSRTALTAGVVFHIPAGCVHRFVTESTSMDVIAYHPDTDWGPTHEDHPMLNRTWLDGERLDNSVPTHEALEIVTGREELMTQR